MPDGAETAGQGLLGGYDVGEQVGFLLRRAHQRHASLFQDAMAAIDLTPTQFNALIRVVELGAVGQNHLGRLSAMDPATIQGVVRRLVQRGIVQRGADPTDRRASVLTPTPAGLTLAARAAALGHGVTEATLAPLSPAERRTFLKLLGKMS
jgi:DNA-binding MarR family transcriptional regulator